jgi:hypothetical protein
MASSSSRLGQMLSPSKYLSSGNGRYIPICFISINRWESFWCPRKPPVLCDKVYQWLATGRWFSPGTPVSSTNKSDRHDIAEILIKVALNTIKQTNNKWRHYLLRYISLTPYSVISLFILWQLCCTFAGFRDICWHAYGVFIVSIRTNAIPK